MLLNDDTYSYLKIILPKGKPQTIFPQLRENSVQRMPRATEKLRFDELQFFLYIKTECCFIPCFISIALLNYSCLGLTICCMRC